MGRRVGGGGDATRALSGERVRRGRAGATDSWRSAEPIERAVPRARARNVSDTLPRRFISAVCVDSGRGCFDRRLSHALLARLSIDRDGSAMKVEWIRCSRLYSFI